MVMFPQRKHCSSISQTQQTLNANIHITLLTAKATGLPEALTKSASPTKKAQKPITISKATKLNTTNNKRLV